MINKKIKLVLYSLFFGIFLIQINFNVFAYWYYSKELDGLAWITEELTFPRDCWMAIDENDDGIGYYYCFDEDGRLLADTITSDYQIVDFKGRKIDRDGEPISVMMKDGKIDEPDSSAEELFFPEDVYVKESKAGSISEGFINNIETDPNEFGPQLYLQNEVAQEGQNIILGKNVKLKEEKSYYDPDISKECVDHISGGNNYSKKVNGTTFNKVKWKGVMALKGTGAFVEITNPSNNFNRVRGKIATHYFSYTERETICSLNVTDENEYDYYSTSQFNYNGGVNFDFVFPRKVKKLIFTLTVNGQYTSRVAYIKDLKFGFDKEAYLEELEEDEYDSMFLTESDEVIVDDNEEDDDETNDDFEETESQDESGNDSYAGPGFDKSLNATKSQIVAPDGSVYNNLIPGKEG